MKLFSDFSELLAEFARSGVEAVIVGGYAVGFHAQPRFTKDIDLVLGGDPGNLARAADALLAFGAPPSIADAVRTLAEGEVVWIGQSPLRIDFLRTIAGVDTTQLFARAVQTSFDGVPVRVIGFDDLILNKRAVGRPQDLLDVASLERARAALR